MKKVLTCTNSALHTFVTWRTLTYKGINFIFASTPVLTWCWQTFRKVIITMLTTKTWTAKTIVGTLLVLANTIVTYPLIVFCSIILDFGFAFGAFIYIFTGIPCKKMISYDLLLNKRLCHFFYKKWLPFFAKLIFRSFATKVWSSFDQVPGLKPDCTNFGYGLPS